MSQIRSVCPLTGLGVLLKLFWNVGIANFISKLKFARYFKKIYIFNSSFSFGKLISHKLNYCRFYNSWRLTAKATSAFMLWFENRVCCLLGRWECSADMGYFLKIFLIYLRIISCTLYRRLSLPFFFFLIPHEPFSFSNFLNSMSYLLIANVVKKLL